MTASNPEQATEGKPPKQIELNSENYDAIHIEDDGTLVLELADDAAKFLHSEGFARDES